MCQKSNVEEISDPNCESIPFEVLSILTVFLYLIYTLYTYWDFHIKYFYESCFVFHRAAQLSLCLLWISLSRACVA